MAKLNTEKIIFETIYEFVALNKTLKSGNIKYYIIQLYNTI